MTDNLGAHKVAGVTDAIEASRAKRTLSSSVSPDLSPIEQVFSKLKAVLRKAAERPVAGLWRRIRLLLRTISKQECINFSGMQAMRQRDRNPLLARQWTRRLASA